MPQPTPTPKPNPTAAKTALNQLAGSPTAGNRPTIAQYAERSAAYEVTTGLRPSPMLLAYVTETKGIQIPYIHLSDLFFRDREVFIRFSAHDVELRILDPAFPLKKFIEDFNRQAVWAVRPVPGLLAVTVRITLPEPKEDVL
jgi:hypothetical protein